MGKNIAKEKILQACMEKQEELVKNFENRVNELKADAFNHNQSASQSENRSTSKVELLSTLETELNFVRNEMDNLKAIKPDVVNTKAEPGAVVVTGKMTFFIAVSSEKVEVDGAVIYGISPKAPIYKAMQGLEKGSTFEFNETGYKIEDVY